VLTWKNSVVVIPALGLSTPKEWPWIQKLVKDVAPNADVWEYIYCEPRHASLGDSLLREGHNLLASLYKNCTARDAISPVGVHFSDPHLPFCQ
jgi:hypothetical protein